MTAAVKWYEIPKGTPEAECRACSAVIYFVEQPSGKKMPVDPDVDGGFGPGAMPGHGVSHFTTCTDPNRFSKGGRR